MKLSPHLGPGTCGVIFTEGEMESEEMRTLREELEMSIASAKHEIRMLKDLIPTVGLIHPPSAIVMSQLLPAIEEALRTLERENVHIGRVSRALSEAASLSRLKIH